MPGDPSVPDTVAACSEVGTVGHKVAALAAATKAKPAPKCFGCGPGGHVKANCPARQENPRNSASSSAGVTCSRWGKTGHFAEQCWSKFPASGQPLQGNGKASARGPAAIKNPSCTSGARHLSASGSRAELSGQQDWCLHCRHSAHCNASHR